MSNSVSDDRAALLDRIARCSDRAQLTQLIASLLGCACIKLKVDGPVWCAQGKQILLGEAVYLSTGCEIWDLGPVEIGSYAVCGPGVKIRAEPGRPVRIGQRVWLGEGVEVAPDSTIGDDAIICASTRISGAIPAGAVMLGNPPRLVRMVR